MIINDHYNNIILKSNVCTAIAAIGWSRSAVESYRFLGHMHVILDNNSNRAIM